MFIGLNLRKKNLNEKALNKPSISRWKTINFRKGTFMPLSSSKCNNDQPSIRKLLKTSGNSLKSNSIIPLMYLIKYKYGLIEQTSMYLIQNLNTKKISELLSQAIPRYENLK